MRPTKGQGSRKRQGWRRLQGMASLCFHPDDGVIEIRDGIAHREGEVLPGDGKRALATEKVWRTGVAAKAVAFSAAVAVKVTDPPPRMMALVPLISMMSVSLEV